MPENNQNRPDGSFKEAVCIDCGRVYDSCCDRDCIEDLQCYFTPGTQLLVDNATSVRLKNAEVLNVYIDVDQVNFNRGYYACDMTFFFLVELDLFTVPHTLPETVEGFCVFTKRVILYGSEGNVKVFTNEDYPVPVRDYDTNNYPKCVVQTVEPVALNATLGVNNNSTPLTVTIPEAVTRAIGGTPVIDPAMGIRSVFVTLGLFSIVQLIRNVQMLIPVYDFCIPEKQCTDVTDEPCDVFRRIKFPTDDFFPPKATNDDCGCNVN